MRRLVADLGQWIFLLGICLFMTFFTILFAIFFFLFCWNAARRFCTRILVPGCL